MHITFLQVHYSALSWHVSLRLQSGPPFRISKQYTESSCLHRASIVSKTLFIVPTDARYYKIIEMLKQFKIIILAPTCFGSRRNHHQRAVLWHMPPWHWLCLYRRAQKNHFVVLAKHRTALWWWFLREPKHVGASIRILNCFNISMIL